VAADRGHKAPLYVTSTAESMPLGASGPL
jgi:hypothetical protein